ncbi:unnamed protein product [Brassicogethes aeneus]|uniref:C2H2-type domain-containing protein n=1 Tax=Brassicogethes aeneus TaxID=1431903 RepID=A0A9P0AS04_BRAAE|nr:unnamed protein product [Brassicogethes aeneus]
MLMRENMKQSMIQSVNHTNSDLTLTPILNMNKKNYQNIETSFACPDCDRVYKLKSSLRNHQKWECGKEPQFKCPYCSYKAKQKMHMARHMERMHREIDYSAIKTEIKSESIIADKANNEPPAQAMQPM